MNEYLTEEQKELVSKNHNLIYGFANKMNISADEYYDLLSIALCNAAKKFDKDKGKFSTYAYRCMQNEMNEHWRSLQKKSVIPYNSIYYYDILIDCDEEKIPKDFVDYYSHKDIISGIMLNEFIDGLTEREKYIVDCLENGMTHKEISATMNCTRQNVSNIVKKIGNKLIDFLF